ncbi:MAG TPA: hypothetical protein VEW91_02455 [bacterium]|nr:hypothetical protein [bacterium]
MATVDDLARIAHLAGLSITRSDLERLAPILEALYADLDRLRKLPIAELEPAFTPRPPDPAGRAGGGAP